jgi:TDG/mug DNA glycosylase family protein
MVSDTQSGWRYPGNQGGAACLQPILRPGLDLIVVGYNPSLPAWRTGHYYANPGNRFYRLLFESGLTPRLLRPDEDRTLPTYGIGVTDLVPLPSARADHLPMAHFREAVAERLGELAELAPRVVCCNGLGVYRLLAGREPLRPGLQPDHPALPGIAIFAVPSSSGLVNGLTAERLAAWKDVARWLGHARKSAIAPFGAC